MLTALDHVNIQTHEPEVVAAWYEEVLHLRRGHRPPIPVPGIWLYLGEDPVVHVVEVARRPEAAGGSLEHFAFRANGIGEFRERLERLRVPYDLVPVPGTDIVQFNVHDPMGNHLHVDFRGETS